MFKRLPKTLTANLATSGTLKLGVLDKVALRDSGHRLFANGVRYNANTDFTIAADPNTGEGTLTWLHATTLTSGSIILIAIAFIDSISSSDGSGGGGGGDVNLIQIGGTTVAKGSGAITAGTLRAVLATDQPAVPISSTTIGAGGDAVGANTVIGQLKEANDTLGGKADAAWTSGDGTLAALLKAIAERAVATAGTLIQPTTYNVRRTITPGTPIAAGKALLVNVTTAGVFTATLPDTGGTMAFNLAVGLSMIDRLAVVDGAWSSGGAGTAWVLDVV